MKREHLIIIAVVIFVLVACAGSALVGIVFFPTKPAVVTNDNNGTWTPPELTSQPQQQTPNAPKSYAGPRDPASAPTPSRKQDPIDYMPGVWQCVQASAQFPYKSALQFAPSSDGSSGFAYYSADPYPSDAKWMELRFQLGVEGHLQLWAAQVPEGRTPTTTYYWLEWPETDMQTLLIYSAAEGDDALPPAVMIRVQ